MTKETQKYEKNFNTLKEIADELSRQEIGIDAVISQGHKAAEAAKTCINILKKEKGNFLELEKELQALANEVEEFMAEEE